MEKSMKNKGVIVIAIATLTAGCAGFFGGMKYQQSKGSVPNPIGGQMGPGGQGGSTNQTKGGSVPNGNMNGGQNRPVTGEITAVDADSITVKSADGSSKIVLISGTTTFYKVAESTEESLKIGESVNVMGTISSDGTLSATNIQLGSALGQNRGNPAPGQ